MCASFGICAYAASPYVSLQDRYLNDRIAQMAVMSGMSTLKRPYAVADVRAHLGRIRQSAPGLYSQINNALQHYEASAALDRGELTVAKGSERDHEKFLVNARGETVASSYRGSAVGHFTVASWLSVSAGAYKSESSDSVQPLESYFSVGGELLQLDIGVREHWYSPFNDWSMLKSTHARSSPSISLSNPLPYENWWNLQFEVFLERLETTPNIRVGSVLQSGRPNLLGTHMSLSPLDGWTLSFNRMFEFGGADRSTSLSDVWDAFWDPVRNDNNTEIDCDEADKTLCETGDQLASVNNRIDFLGETPVSLYFEFAGGDTAALSNVRLGNLVTQFGIFVPFMPSGFLGHDWSFNYEYGAMQNEWYYHHVYRDTYANDGISMGHWLQENKVKGDKVGGVTQTVKLGWQLSTVDRLDFFYRQLKNDDYGKIDYSLFRESGLNWRTTMSNLTVDVALLHGTDVYSDSYSRVAFSLLW